MRYGTIVAYTYRADMYCPRCIVGQVMEMRPDVFRNPEGDLNIIAENRGINREDEATFDSWDFPKVVLYDHLHDSNRHFFCGDCGEDIVN